MPRDDDDRDFGHIDRMVLLALFKEGPLTLAELEEKTDFLKTGFGFGSERRKNPQTRKHKTKSVVVACNTLVDGAFVCLGGDGKYSLTETGKTKATRTVNAMEKGVNILENQILSPSATARNTIVGYVFMAAVKVFFGLFFGSVGLIADGADTSVDSASAGVVWLGIKFKREIAGMAAVLALMFATAGMLLYESAISILENVRGTFLPMAMPLIVVFVELIALVFAFTFSMYQRFVGRRSQSLALISQSVDSQNSVYSAAAVIIGAVCSIFGVYWVDAVVGGFIALRITWDGLDLTKQAVASLRGTDQTSPSSRFHLKNKLRLGEWRASGTGYSMRFTKKT